MVSKPIRSRSANAASITAARLSCCMILPFERALRYPSGSEGVNNGRLPPRFLAVSSADPATLAGPRLHAARSRHSLPDGFLDRCAAIVGPERVSRAADDRAPYEVDFWQSHRWTGRRRSLRPRTIEEVAALVALAATAGVAIVPQGGNTGLVGGGDSRPLRPAGGREPGRARPDPSGRSARRVAGGRGGLHAGDGTGGGRGGRPAVSARASAARAPARSAAISPAMPAASTSSATAWRASWCSGSRWCWRDGRIWNGLRTLRKDNTGYDLKQAVPGRGGQPRASSPRLPCGCSPGRASG